MIRALSVCLIFFVLACSTTRPIAYQYRPTPESIQADVENSAFYRITPRGQIEVTSLGLADVETRKSHAPLRMMQLRIILVNQGKKDDWTFNTSDQLLMIRPGGWIRPALVNSDLQGLPQVRVLPGERRIVDLYYSLPPEKDSLAEIPAFRFRWELEAAGRAIQETTPFERISESPDQKAVARIRPFDPIPYRRRSDFEFAHGWGPVWYFSPDFRGEMAGAGAEPEKEESSK